MVEAKGAKLIFFKAMTIFKQMSWYYRHGKIKNQVHLPNSNMSNNFWKCQKSVTTVILAEDHFSTKTSWWSLDNNNCAARWLFALKFAWQANEQDDQDISFVGEKGGQEQLHVHACEMALAMCAQTVRNKH